VGGGTLYIAALAALLAVGWDGLPTALQWAADAGEVIKDQLLAALSLYIATMLAFYIAVVGDWPVTCALSPSG